MDPLSSSAPIDLAALLGSVTAPKEAQVRAALLRLLGQELDVLFEARTPEGLTLRLPQGQALVAQGDLPYPEGTLLKVQVLPPATPEGPPRLQPLAAQLPPAPPLLAPLVQGEAAALLQRLQAEDPPPALRVLAALFQRLDALDAPPTRASPLPAAPADAPPAPGRAATAPAPSQAPLPSAPPAQPPAPAQVPPLPPALRTALTQVLGDLLPPPSLEGRVQQLAGLPEGRDLAAALLAQAEPALAPDLQRLRALLPEAAPPQARPPVPAGSPAPAPLPPPFLRFLETLPPARREALQSWLSDRLPAPSLESQVQRWLAAPPGPATPLPTAPLPAAPASPGLTPRAPAPPGGAAALPWRALPAPLQDALLPLLLGDPLPPSPQDASPGPRPAGIPAPPSARPGPAVPPALLQALEALPAPERQALARSLSLPPAVPLEPLAQALRTAILRPSEAAPPLPPALKAALLLPESGPEGPGRPPGLRTPQIPELERALAAWPDPLKASLAQALQVPLPPPVPGARPPALPPVRDLAEALVRWIAQLEEAGEPGTKGAKGGSGRTAPGRTALPAALDRLLAHPALPPSLKEAAAQWFRALMAAPLEGADPRPSSDRGPAPSPSTAPAPAPGAKAADPSQGPGLRQAEPWEAWVKGSTQVLADPKASPREAPFHALQGLERSAFFELPLPGRGSGPLQLWVEEDASPDPGAPPVHRVLMSLRFTALGETRVGLVKAGGSLSVRIWAEHPRTLEGVEAELRASLEDLGGPVSLGFAALDPGAPTVRALAAGPGYQGLA